MSRQESRASRSRACDRTRVVSETTHLSGENEVAMSKRRFPSGKFLINRAMQCRSIANKLFDPVSRDRMISLAIGYEEIAKSAAKLKIENIELGELEGDHPLSATESSSALHFLETSPNLDASFARRR